jgi:hypothetical protein
VDPEGVVAHKHRQYHGVCLEVLTDTRGKSLRIASIPADILSFYLSNSRTLLQQPAFSAYFVGAERFCKESLWKTEEDMVGHYKNGSVRGNLRNDSQQNTVNSPNSTLSITILSSLKSFTP